MTTQDRALEERDEEISHVVVSPHIDDAWFSLGGSMAAWRKAGHRVHVLNVFSTQTWTVLGNLPVRLCTWVRKAEEARNAAALGVRLGYLDFRESHLRGYRLFFPQPVNWQRDSALFREVCSMVDAWLVALAPTHVYFPLGMGGHVDHQVVHRVGTELLLREPRTPHPALAYYEDLPYAARSSLPLSEVVEQYRLEPRIMPVDLAQKLVMVRRHRSQTSRGVVDDIRSYALALDSEHHAAERLWFAGKHPERAAE